MDQLAGKSRHSPPRRLPGRPQRGGGGRLAPLRPAWGRGGGPVLKEQMESLDLGGLCGGISGQLGEGPIGVRASRSGA